MLTPNQQEVARMTPQCMAALEAANRVRFAQADAKRGLRAGTLSMRDVLRMPECNRARVRALLAAQRGWGEVRVTRVMKEIGGSPWLTVERLSLRQRMLLCELLDDPLHRVNPVAA